MQLLLRPFRPYYTPSKYTILLLSLLLIIFADYLPVASTTISSADVSKVQCETSKGSLTIEVHNSWAPLGAERFLNLVQDGFYTDIAFFRCVKGFLTQFGISDNPGKKHWHREQIRDDPNIGMGIKKNYVSFAGGGPNTRSTQIFIAFEDLDFLGKEPWETPFGVVIEGQKTLEGLYKGYGDIPPFGEGPDQQEIFRKGNDYIRELYPDTDFLHTCRVISEATANILDVLPPEDDASAILGEGHEIQPNEILKPQSSISQDVERRDALDKFAQAMESVDEKEKATADDESARRSFQEQMLADDIAKKGAVDDAVRAEASGKQLRGATLEASAERNVALIYRAVGLMVLFFVAIACFVSFGKRSSKAQ